MAGKMTASKVDPVPLKRRSLPFEKDSLRHLMESNKIGLFRAHFEAFSFHDDKVVGYILLRTSSVRSFE